MTTPTHKFLTGHVLDVLAQLPDESVHTAVTSPPYWGLRAYGTEPQAWHDGWSGELGTEPHIDLYVAHLVEVFRELRRVLRRDGSLWLNIDDTYSRGRKFGAPEKNLCGIPWRVVLALQRDGWHLRSDVIWRRRNTLPEAAGDRLTREHEYVFLLTKSPRGNYYDPLNAREHEMRANGRTVWDIPVQPPDWHFCTACRTLADRKVTACTNCGRDDAWLEHFATFPVALPERCIAITTSDAGCCPYCGAPWHRVVLRIPPDEFNAREGLRQRLRSRGAILDGGGTTSVTLGLTHKIVRRTVGWKPSCNCQPHDPVPCVVIDPFAGSGTTTLAAHRLGRSSIYIDLNPLYTEVAKQRLAREVPQT